MTAKLIRSDGTAARVWQTNDSKAAMTADRNCPAGWYVEVTE